MMTFTPSLKLNETPLSIFTRSRSRPMRIRSATLPPEKKELFTKTTYTAMYDIEYYKTNQINHFIRCKLNVIGSK